MATNKNSKYQLLVYSESCQIKLRKFKTMSALNGFISKFHKKYGNDAERAGDPRIDYVVKDVTGEIVIHDSGNWLVN